MALTRGATGGKLPQRKQWANGAPLPDAKTLTRVAIVGAVLFCCAIAGRWASPYLLVASIATAALLMILPRPWIGLAILPVIAMAVPFEIQASTSVAVNAAVWMVPLLLGVWVLDMLRRRELRLVRSAANAPAFTFVLAASLSLALGNIYWDPFVPRPGNVLWVQLGQWSILVFSMLALWLGANLLADVGALKLVTYAYLVTGGGLAILHTLPVLGPVIAEVKPPGATTSVYWVWLSALACGQLLFNRRLPPAAKLFCVLVLAALWTFAIGPLRMWMSGLVPMAVALAMLVALRFRRRAIWVFLVIGLVAAVLFPLAYQELGWRQELEVSGAGRLEHYQIVLQFAMRHPWFGLGMAAYRHYSWTVPVLIQETLYRGAQVSSHNNYIDIFAQMGVVGLAVLAWLALIIGRIGWRASRRFTEGFEGAFANAALAGLVGSLVSAAFGDWVLPFVYNIGLPGFRSSVMAWVFLGGLIALEAGSGSTFDRANAQGLEV
jgi:O-antigen ligase